MRASSYQSDLHPSQRSNGDHVSTLNQPVQAMLNEDETKQKMAIPGIENKEEGPASQTKMVQFALNEEEEPPASQTKMAQFALNEDEMKPPSQGKFITQTARDDSSVAPYTATVQRASDGKVPGNVMSKMETSIGADFSDVNIHEGSQASSIGALAYTQGSDIHFAQGKFDTGSTSGQELLGHELTHVKQQKEGRVTPTTSVQGMPVNDSPALEGEADRMGAAAARAPEPSQLKTAQKKK